MGVVILMLKIEFVGKVVEVDFFSQAAKVIQCNSVGVSNKNSSSYVIDFYQENQLKAEEELQKASDAGLIKLTCNIVPDDSDVSYDLKMVKWSKFDKKKEEQKLVKQKTNLYKKFRGDARDYFYF